MHSFRWALRPYDAGGGHIRPAHFHLMITAAGYQPLVTQLYFSGDVNISKDLYASSTIAKRRILDVRSLNDGTKKVLYDVSMSEILAADPSAIDKLTGVYTDEKDKSKKMEFFKKNNVLWMKNEVFGKILNTPAIIHLNIRLCHQACMRQVVLKYWLQALYNSTIAILMTI